MDSLILGELYRIFVVNNSGNSMYDISVIGFYPFEDKMEYIPSNSIILFLGTNNTKSFTYYRIFYDNKIFEVDAHYSKFEPLQK